MFLLPLIFRLHAMATPGGMLSCVCCELFFVSLFILRPVADGVNLFGGEVGAGKFFLDFGSVSLTISYRLLE